MIMKIAQVNLGLLPIPPNGWGATEKVIWAYKLGLEEKGHQVNIPYINEIEKGQYDIVHVHAWNHALEMRNKGIPYVFSLHDHHTVIYGRDSELYKLNLEAMRYAQKAIVYAKFLVEYFENIPVYVPHGVDLQKYTHVKKNDGLTNLLCIGNNGLYEDKAFDRKGFRYAIKAAKVLDLPITVVGPTNNNKLFFEQNDDLLKYEKLNVLYDLSDDQLLNVIQEHSVLIHATEIEAGHPPLTILEAAACGLPVLTTDCNGELYTIPIERNTESIVSKLKDLKKLYDLKVIQTQKSVKEFDWSNVVDKLLLEYQNKEMQNNMKKSILNVYNNIKRVNIQNKISINFVDGANVEITGQDKKDYTVYFIDQQTGDAIYSTNLSNNTWAKTNLKYSVDWLIRIKSNDGEIFEHKFDCKGKRVLISFESSSLGDTLAWIPYVEEYRKKHGCVVFVSTFMNELFKPMYPEINFINPGEDVSDLYALYRLGIFYTESGFDNSKHKSDYRKLRLQEVATDILNLDFQEIKPKLYIQNKEKSIDGEYVTIGIHSTAQLKYWNNKTGWQDTVDYLNSRGIKTVHISKQSGEYMNNFPPNNVVDKTGDLPLQDRITDILNSKMFIGISSGLSWVAWALGVPTVIISGCTEEVHEPTNGVYRIINQKSCNSCFSNHYFNKGDWNWCPEHKGTERQFECSKSITFKMVEPILEKILNK